VRMVLMLVYRAACSSNYGGPIRQDRIQSSLSWSVRPSRNCMALMNTNWQDRPEFVGMMKSVCGSLLVLAK